MKSMNVTNPTRKKKKSRKISEAFPGQKLPALHDWPPLWIHVATTRNGRFFLLCSTSLLESFLKEHFKQFPLIDELAWLFEVGCCGEVTPCHACSQLLKSCHSTLSCDVTRSFLSSWSKCSVTWSGDTARGPNSFGLGASHSYWDLASRRSCSPAYQDFKRSVGLAPETELFIINGNPNSLNVDLIRKR